VSGGRPMRWRSTHSFAVAAIVACTLYGAYDGLQTHQLISLTIGGFIAGLFICGAGAIVLWLARRFREIAPRVAWWVETVLFWIGTALAVYCLGLTAYLLYEGAPGRIIAFIVGGAAIYFILGWGARRLIAPAQKSWINPAS
jgi:hypothetical protein